ncbi:MAG TPA: hypothetical protein VHJ77_02410 [Vicinamibacterales bacterium]|nr:hypothetical protein [Vicinamibacterales bacterium]
MARTFQCMRNCSMHSPGRRIYGRDVKEWDFNRRPAALDVAAIHVANA